jgi:predicted nuclease of predicted toxin-antitoxin system
MDVQVEMAITQGLRRRGVVVLHAQENGTDRFSDPDLLDRATALGYVAFTRDIDFLIEGARRQSVENLSLELCTLIK